MAAAVALHALLGGMAWQARGTSAPPLLASRPPLASSVADEDAIDVSLLLEWAGGEPRAAVTRESAPDAASRGDASAASMLASRGIEVGSGEGERAFEVGSGEGASDAAPGAAGEASPESASRPPPKRRLSLEALGVTGGSYRLDLMDQSREAQPEPDVGGLRRGLAARDAARGYGTGGAAVSAAHGAALAQGLRGGKAIFDVIFDREGRVQSVTVIQARPSGSEWDRVAQALAARLRGRRLRLPAGTNGVRTRVEVAVGRDAADPRAKPQLPRGAGVHEEFVADSKPDTRARHTESTREHIYGEPGVLSPTAGVGGVGISKATQVGRSARIHVALISETLL